MYDLKVGLEDKGGTVHLRSFQNFTEQSHLFVNQLGSLSPSLNMCNAPHWNDPVQSWKSFNMTFCCSFQAFRLGGSCIVGFLDPWSSLELYAWPWRFSSLCFHPFFFPLVFWGIMSLWLGPLPFLHIFLRKEDAFSCWCWHQLIVS